MMLTPGDPTNGEEGGGFKYDQTHPDFYRCPVSTPANNNKRPLDDYDPITEDIIGPSIQERKSVIGFSRPALSRSRTRDIEKPMRKNVEYYFVDKTLQTQEMNQTNNYWLRSLCAQPVTEILTKYRRKSELQRTRYLWSKMFSTPGERALLQAWTNNSGSPQRATTSTTKTRSQQQHQQQQQQQQLSLSNEMKVYSIKSAGSRKSDFEANQEELRPHVTSASGYHQQYIDSRPESKQLSRESPVIRTGDPSFADDTNVSRIVLADTEALPNLNGQRRKGQLILQQRKYFSGNRKHSAIPHVQRLNPVKTEDIAPSADVICLKPTFKPPTPRVMSRGYRPVSRDQQSSAHSTSDMDKIPYKFPLIISTRQESDDKGESEHQA